MQEVGKWENLLGRNTATACKHVQANTFSQENMPGLSPDSRNMLNRLEGFSFL